MKSGLYGAIKTIATYKPMPKHISKAEFDALRLTVSLFPEGASIDAISSALLVAVPRRTLQRRLAVLVERQELELIGKGRSSYYRIKAAIAPTATLTLNDPIKDAPEELYVPIDDESEATKRSVRRPLKDRHPVGYNRDFLDAYQANRTFYVPETARRHLLDMGRSQSEPQPAGTHALSILNRLLIDLTWNSSRLEGNTYSLLETERLLGEGQSAEGKGARETQMILNHKAAIELLVEPSSDLGFNHYTLCNLHALLSDNLLPDQSACGRLREHPVGIGGSVFHPLDGLSLVQERFQYLLTKVIAIEDPIEQAFFTMVHVPYLQPFDDVNKRVSRLAANIPLIRENLSPLSFVDVPEKAYIDGLLGVYELNQTNLLCDVFIWAYERSCARYSAVQQSLGEPDLFRLRYRDAIAGLIGKIVLDGQGPSMAVASIKQYADINVPKNDRSRFLEVTETEIMSLHIGNISRYRLRPSQFNRWEQMWRSGD